MAFPSLPNLDHISEEGDTEQGRSWFDKLTMIA